MKLNQIFIKIVNHFEFVKVGFGQIKKELFKKDSIRARYTPIKVILLIFQELLDIIRIKLI